MHDISLHILDLIENSLRARATIISIIIAIDEPNDSLSIRIEDNGVGFTEPQETLTNPFYTTNGTKKTGLGLSLFQATVEMAGGSLNMRNLSSSGTLIDANMQLSHVNRPAFGDLSQSISTMVCTNPEIDFRLKIISEEIDFEFSSLAVAGLDAKIKTGNIELAKAVSNIISFEQQKLKKFEQYVNAPKKKLG